MVHERDGKCLNNLNANDEGKRPLGGNKCRQEGKIEKKN